MYNRSCTIATMDLAAPLTSLCVYLTWKQMSRTERKGGGGGRRRGVGGE